ncbi:MAG: glycosyltransferase family 2 protein [Lachnospiraceae bacterium]|nr:glycosyltransferase family 2 protein [Lachnospiraceae bacterium]
MKFQLLISALNKEPKEMINRMKIDSPCLIMIQTDKTGEESLQVQGNEVKVFYSDKRGVGLSRNTLLEKADSDICLFGDDDLIYEEGYDKKVLKAFEEYPEADMMVFNLNIPEDRKTYHIEKSERVRLWNCGRYGTAGLAVKRESVINKNIRFSTLFGGGAKYSNGEDSLFISDCLKAGLIMRTYPATVASEEGRESTWFKGYDRKFFFDRGVLYKFLYGKLAMAMAFRFVFLKRKNICRDIPWQEAFKIMREGIHETVDQHSGSGS